MNSKSMSSNQQVVSGRLRHLMSSSSFMDMKLAGHLAGHTHGPSCSTGCGHAQDYDPDDAKYTAENYQDGDIGE